MKHIQPRPLLSILSAILFLLILLPSVAKSETEIEWWQFWTDPSIKPVIQQLVSDFEKDNPGITVKLTDLTWANGHEKIVIALASGTGPDVLELGSDWIAQFADYGHLEILSGDILDDKEEYDGWSMATYNEEIYARPWFLGTRVLFINKELLVRTRFDYDFVPTFWRQLTEIVKRVHGLGDDYYGWGSNIPEKHRLYKKFLPFFWSMKAQFFSDDGLYCVISSEKAVKALTYYKKLHDNYSFVGKQREIEDAFLDGKIGVIISGDWLLKRIELGKRKIDFATAHIPGPSFLGPSFMGGEFLAINSASKNKEAAAKFIAYITSPENQLLFCKANRSANPSSKKTQADEYFTQNEHLMTFIRQLRTSLHPPVVPDWVMIEGELEAAVEDALFGSGLPATALRNAQVKITQARGK